MTAPTLTDVENIEQRVANDLASWTTANTAVQTAQSALTSAQANLAPLTAQTKSDCVTTFTEVSQLLSSALSQIGLDPMTVLGPVFLANVPPTPGTVETIDSNPHP